MTDVVDTAFAYPADTRIAVVAPMLIPNGRTFPQHLEILRQGGYSRLYRDGEYTRIVDLLKDTSLPAANPGYELLIDRLSVSDEADDRSRLADSAETAFLRETMH